MKQPTLFDPADPLAGPPAPPQPPDQAARDFAVDPHNDVVLEASAGTGKTRVLVERYARLIEAGVEPRNILAITFTRKAAAEMRERVLAELRQRADRGAITAETWRRLCDRVADIEISTIDAFCFRLLREFPLEANVDPAFDIADETEVARFANEALDLTFRATRHLLTEDEHVRLLFARVKLPVLRGALASLIDQRHVALPLVASVVARDGHRRRAVDVSQAFIADLRTVIETSSHRNAIENDGPAASPEFAWLLADLRALDAFPAGDPVRTQQLRRRLERYFLTVAGTPRQRLAGKFTVDLFASKEARKRHEAGIAATADAVHGAIDRLDQGVNTLLTRGLLRVLMLAVRHYEQRLEEHALLDFAGMLDRSVALLERQEEFARSRLKLQARYHHLLVDEFQDTSRRQWRLIELLIDAWGEGEGTADAPTSIFIVGDRKQSIYRFRHADVRLLDEAAVRIFKLRPGRTVRQAISTSFRAVPELLAFVNALGARLQGDTDLLAERFGYNERDRFPVPEVAPGARRDGRPVLGLVAQPSMADCAAAVAHEIAQIIGRASVRDRAGPARLARPDDIAVLFRARHGHQFFEAALEGRGVRTYVYKGLGFFDAPEVQDLQALVRYLARPDSDLRAAELLRSRLVRVSDVALAAIAPRFAHVLLAPQGLRASTGLSALDTALLEHTRAAVPRWLELADRVPPSELVDIVLADTAYAYELRGRRHQQARENVKKVRALLRRIENRGYATLGRLAAYFDTLRAGDESNAIVEASGAVSLMTMHAAKGLEFPIVFLVNLHLGGRGRPTGFSLIEPGPGHPLPEVAFYSTTALALEERREDQELRRLLYVAATRARDRLYLAAEVDAKGALRRGTRSLGALLKTAGLDAPFQAAASVLGAAAAGAAGGSSAEAANGVDEVEWTTGEGTFAFTVCRPPHEPDDVPVQAPTPVPLPVLTEVPADSPIDDEHEVPFQVTAVTTIGARSAASHDRGPAAGAEDDTRGARLQQLRRHESADRQDDQLIGTIVHRLFQRGIEPAHDEGQLVATIGRLFARDELALAGDPDALMVTAARMYRQFRERPDVAALLASGQCFVKDPFSYQPHDRPGEFIRGQVDCLVVGDAGRATVVEFKTGALRPEHRVQADLYASAMVAALGTGPVSVRIVYP